MAPTTGTRRLGDLLHPLGNRVGRLAIVDQQFDLVRLEVVLEGGDVGSAGLGVVHHRKLEGLVPDLHAERVEQVAEDRLGRRDGRAGQALAELADLRLDRLHRFFELREPLLVSGLVGGIFAHQRVGKRLGQRRHRRRVVPNMRVVAGLLPDQIGDDDRLAIGRAGGREEFLHPRVIVDAVVDDDARARDRPGPPTDSPRTDAGPGRDC